MAGTKGKGTRRARVPKSRSMPSTAGAKPRGGYSFGDSTFPRAPKQFAAPGSGPMIKPSRAGTFTAKAKAAGKTPLAFAKQVLANKAQHDPKTVQQANFANNFGGASRARAKRGGSK